MNPNTAARYSYAFALGANGICFLINFSITAGYLIAGQWRAGGLQSLILLVPAVLIYVLHLNDQRRTKWLSLITTEIEIRQQMLQHLKDGTATATLDDDPGDQVRH